MVKRNDKYVYLCVLLQGDNNYAITLFGAVIYYQYRIDGSIFISIACECDIDNDYSMYRIKVKH